MSKYHKKHSWLSSIQATKTDIRYILQKGTTVMKLVRILLATVAVTIFNAVVGALMCGWLFNWVYKIEPINVWKPMDGPPGVSVMVGSFVLGLILVVVYAMLNKGIPGSNRLLKGLIFGLCVWAVGILPGMFATFSFMTVAPTVLIYWTVLFLIVTPLKGLIIAAIYGK